MIAVWLNGERVRSSVEQTLLNFGLNRFGKAIVELMGERQQLSSLTWIENLVDR